MNRSLKTFAVAFLAFGVSIIMFVLFPAYAPWIMGANAVVLLGVGISMYQNHRCPACKQVLVVGNKFMFGMKHCPQCGAKLNVSDTP